MLRSFCLGAWCVAVCAFAAGCGQGEDAGKVTVSGKVDFNGKPVDKGTVTFLSADGKGDSASAHIVHGEYSIKTSPGKKKVVILGLRPPKKPGKKDEFAHGDGSESGEEATEQYLPPEFNSSTKLEYTVEANGGTKDFKLTGREQVGDPAARNTQRRE